MKLTFYGAAKMVTGSCHCIQVNGKNYLIDCGLKQGTDEDDNSDLHFYAGDIEAVIVTHAHIDHSGRLPLLIKQGFRGKIYTTRLTAELLEIMLLDSAHIQESDANYENTKRRRSGMDQVEPLYTIRDAEDTIQSLVTFEYGQVIDLGDGIRIKFIDAGHLLGSAIVKMWLSEDGKEKIIVFSGDLGNKNQPIIRDPQTVDEADYLVMESTYGDRLHTNRDYKEELAEIINDTLSRGGNVVIPAFAVGRTQELLYKIREIKNEHLAQGIPDFDVWVDSPLANEATQIYSSDLHGYLDEEAIATLKKEKILNFKGLHLSQSVDESKFLNSDPSPKVIISASGMCDAGRIRHHLKHNLWRQECTVVFVGFQAEGTLGRHIIEGAKKVRLFGEDITVKARIVNLKGLSSHADRDGLLEWVNAFEKKPKEIFVVHGDAPVTTIFTESLRDRGYSAHAPEFHEVYDLKGNKLLVEGIPTHKKVKVYPEEEMYATPSYQMLLEAGNTLLETIHHHKEASKNELQRFTREIRTLIRHWER